MPGAYPKEMLDTQEKRDHFWNTRLGSMTTFLLFIAIVVSLNDFPAITAFSVGAIVAIFYFLFVFRLNLFGRIMSKIKWLNEDD